MEYRQFSPPPDLAAFAECAWLLRGALAPEGQAIVPDGRLELVFHFAEPPFGDGLRQPAVLIAGRMMTALDLRSPGSVDALGVRIRPEAAGCVFPAERLGAVEAADAVLGPGLRQARERIGNARSDEARLELLWATLRACVGTRVHADAAVAESVRRIEAARGQGAVEGFVRDGLGVRQWQRRFLRSTGFTPKAFARIARFQYLIALCESGRARSWADAAVDAGFYDQAHLSNEFRKFSGSSPETFVHGGRGIAEFYRDGFFQDAGRG